MRAVEFLRAHWRPVGVAVALVVVFGAGYGAGKRGRETVVKTVTVESEAKTVYVDRVVTVEKPVDRWRTRTVEVVKYDPEGRKTETVVAHTDSGEHDQGKTVVDEGNLHVDTKTTERETVSRLVPRLRATVELEPGLQSLYRPTLDAAVGATYDLVQLGPFALYVGGRVSVPISPSGPPTVQAVAGLSVTH